MIRKIVTAAVSGLGLLTAMAWADAAQAQNRDEEMELGSRIAKPKPADIPEDGLLSDADRGRVALFGFADCTTRTAPQKTMAYLSLKEDDPQGPSALKNLVDSACLRDGEIKMPNMLLRGALFRSAYLNQFKHAPTALAPAEVDFDTYLNAPQQQSATQYRVLMDFADCVVRKDPADSDKLLRADVASPEESAALAALKPNLGPCMVAGAQVTLNKSVISAVLAEALYREASAVPVVAARRQ